MLTVFRFDILVSVSRSGHPFSVHTYDAPFVKCRFWRRSLLPHMQMESCSYMLPCHDFEYMKREIVDENLTREWAGTIAISVLVAEAK
jgi:hypothetical protein